MMTLRERAETLARARELLGPDAYITDKHSPMSCRYMVGIKGHDGVVDAYGWGANWDQALASAAKEKLERENNPELMPHLRDV